MRRFLRSGFAVLTILLGSSIAAAWNFENAGIDVGEIRSGGPPRDGIPALTHPKYVDAKKAEFLQPEDRVLGVTLDGDARAYPLKILSWHELVNDTIGGKPVLVSW